MDWWKRRESGQPARPKEVISGGNDEDPSAYAEEPMTRLVAFRVLGLDNNASRESIHRAYRKLAKTRHPDRFARLGPAAVATASEAFRRLHDAYQLLSV
jgi:DnaJ-class molecular chaperone